MSNKWITDRLPTEKDAYRDLVWVTICGEVVGTDYLNVSENQPWMPITPPEPYVKQKRYEVWPNINMSGYCVYGIREWAIYADGIPTREAAERIAAIYEEVMP